jgi:hypothetical protein
MKKLINVADLKDPNDSESRTYREVNNATPHKYKIGQLVERDNGARMFIAGLMRDCDGTPLYSLSGNPENLESSYKWSHGHNGEYLSLVSKVSE